MNDFIHKISNDLRITSTSIIGIDCLPTNKSLDFIGELSNSLKINGHNVTIIDIEDFHNPVHFYRFDENVHHAYCNNAYDYATLVHEIISPMVMGKSINKDLLLLDRHLETYSYTKKFEIPNPSTLIIFGFNVFNRPLDMYFTKRVFIEYDLSQPLAINEQHGLKHYFNENEHISDLWNYYTSSKTDHVLDMIIHENNI